MSRDTLITIYGVVAVTFMMTMYALERRHPAFILAFAAGCLASRGAMLRGSGSLTQEQGGVPWPACASQPGPCCGGAVR